MAPEKRHITRNRTSYSCQTCRRRKVKCDRSHPICGACEKNNEECIYLTEKDDHRSGAEQLAELTRKRKSPPETISEPSKAPPEVTATGSRHDKLGQIQELLTQASALADKVDIGHGGSLTSPDDGSEDVAASLQRISERLNSLNLLFHSGSKEPHFQQEDVPSHPHQPQDATNTRLHLMLPRQEIWEQDLSNKSVTEAQSNVIFRCWLSSIFTVLPVVDPFEALEKYNTFQHWYVHDYDRGLPNPVADYMPLIFAIRYGGMLGMTIRGVRRWFPEVPRRMILSTLRLNFWRAVDEVKPSISSVAAEVMMRYMCHERYTMSKSSVQLVMLIRNAQSLGIHRTDDSILTTTTGQVLRRLWWEIVNLDISLTTSCLVPPLLDSHFFDVQLPMELKNHKLGTEEAFSTNESAPPSADFAFDDTKPSIISVHNLVNKTRALCSIYTRKIVALLIGTELTGSSSIAQISHILQEVSVEIQAIINRIPTNDMPEMMEPPPPSTREQSVGMDHGTVNGGIIDRCEITYHLGKQVDVGVSHMPHVHQIELGTNAFHKWARVTLSLMLDQICCFAFGSFLRNPNSKLWSLTRNCAIQSCHNYMRRYLLLASNLELERFRWTWIGMFQPVHASKILLVDLYQCPFSAEALRSRAMFDQMLLLNFPDYGLVGGDQGLTFIHSLEDESQGSWQLLNELRAKAWQKAGLDPTYLWNQEDQLAKLQQDAFQRQQDAPIATGKVRHDQPMLQQKLMQERDWRFNPTSTSKSPFSGLTELIQKIRRSKVAESAFTARVQTTQQQATGSNFFGEQLFSQSNETWPSDTSLDGPQPSVGLSGRPTDPTNVVHDISTATRQREITTHQPSQVSVPLCGDALELGKPHDEAELALASNGHVDSSSDPMSCPTTDVRQVQPTSEATLCLRPEDAHNFDWARWDLAYGYPGSNDVENIAPADADELAGALRYS